MNDYTYNNIESSRREYDALPYSEWRKDYFNEENGGYLVTSWKRIEEAERNRKEKIKFDNEHNICLTYARSGLKIMHYEDDKPEGTFDVICDGFKGDLKRTKGHGNIVRYARYAVKEQGAEIVLFEFEEWGTKVRDAVSEMIRKKYHGYYFISGDQVVHHF